MKPEIISEGERQYLMITKIERLENGIITTTCNYFTPDKIHKFTEKQNKMLYDFIHSGKKEITFRRKTQI